MESVCQARLGVDTDGRTGVADGCESCECGVRKDRQTNGSGKLLVFEDAFSLARDWPSNSKPRGHPAIWKMTIE